MKVLVKGYIRVGESAEEPRLPRLRRSLVDLRLDVGTEVSAIVRSPAFAVAQHALLALRIAERPSWRVLPVVPASHKNITISILV